MEKQVVMNGFILLINLSTDKRYAGDNIKVMSLIQGIVSYNIGLNSRIIQRVFNLKLSSVF